MAQVRKVVLGLSAARRAADEETEAPKAQSPTGLVSAKRLDLNSGPASSSTVPGTLTRLQNLTPTIRTFSRSQPLSQDVPEALWNLGRLNHVAIAVPDLKIARSFYRNMLGAQVSEMVPVPEHGVSVVFVELGNTKLELLHPLGDKSPIESFLKKNKAGGMHHICIEVDDIEAAVTDLKQKKIRILSEEAKIGAHGKPVIFLHPKDCGGVLVELEQA